MDLNNSSTGSGEAISTIPLILKSDRGVGSFRADRSSNSLARTHLGLDLLRTENSRRLSLTSRSEAKTRKGYPQIAAPSHGRSVVFSTGTQC